jgi:tetratricopeptide (TPR) repeat protein
MEKISINKTTLDAQEQKTDICAAEEQFAEGNKAYESDIKELSNPDSAEAYYSMGHAYKKSGEHDKALLCYEKALNVDPSIAEAYHEMGLSCVMEKNYDKAIVYFQKSITINPNSALAYYDMGNVYSELGNRQHAVIYYQKAAQLGYENAQKWLQENGYKW